MIQLKKDHWVNDRPGYESIGVAFKNLIKSINSDRVISIEAGFGRRTTFFRKACAEHLRSEGKVAEDVDLLKSVHTVEPIISYYPLWTALAPPTANRMSVST